jgi:hypothetical protein
MAAVRGHLGVRRRADLRLDSDLEFQLGLIACDHERHDVDLVSPGDFARPNLVVRDWLRVAIDHSQIGLERPPDDSQVERDAVRTGVGQGDDGEATLRHGEQLRELAVRRATVADGVHSVHVAQEPADAEGVAQCAALQLDRRLLHLVQQLGGQDAVAAFCPVIAKMKPGPAQRVGRRGSKIAARVPGGAMSSSSISFATNSASASSPSPVSTRRSQPSPEVWLSRFSTVMVAAASSSASLRSGTYRRTGASSSIWPVTTKRISAVAV